ncbi:MULTISPECIES: helix-turn-helix domain-containing protein [unclassified Clostridium]|uniref:helix-turn-helix domain-containing protein n=1 Tax=unclassified Clostridium TaxID=2614128 RepID=UPI0032172F5A
MLPDIIQNFTLQAPYLNQMNIISFNMGIKSTTGEKILRVKTIDGKVFIKTISLSGIVSTEFIEIPEFNTSQQRDLLIIDLRKKGLIQDDIADYLNISQSTVSNVLRKVVIK